MFDFDKHVRVAKTLMNHLAADGADFQPMAIAIRDGREIAQVIPPESDGGVLVKLGRFLFTGFEADQVLMIADSWKSMLPKNPVTGEDWRGGELAELVAQGGLEKGWVTDALSLTLLDRHGSAKSVTLPYSRAGKRIKWGEPVEAEQIGGRLLDAVPDDVVPMVDGHVRGESDEFVIELLRLQGAAAVLLEPS